jgi:hypothetical protein
MFASVIVGGGPGGLGPLIAAAQAGVLPDLLSRGVAIVDRQRRLGGTIGRYAINADTLGGAFLEFLDAGGLPPHLQTLRLDPVTRKLEVYRDGFPPLGLVHRFMRRLGSRVEELLAGSAASAFYGRTEAKVIHLANDGSLRLETSGPDGRCSVIPARSAVVALGGVPDDRQRDLIGGLRLADCKPANVMVADRIMTHHGIRDAVAIARRNPERPVVILGGSHSAYSSAGALVKRLRRDVAPWLRIVIVQRLAPCVFYPSEAAALDDGYIVGPGDVCPRTLRVNRLGGLRGDGREMWRRIHGRPGTVPEERVSCRLLDTFSGVELRELIEAASLVVPAFGYGAAALSIFDPRGRQLRLAGAPRAVNEQCQILLEDGRSLTNVFGIGLGSGYRPTLAMGGEPNFRGQANSLWLYQNDIGTLVFRGIYAALRNDSPDRSVVDSPAPCYLQAAAPLLR